MIKLHRDPHPGTTTKKKPASSSASASSSTSAAAKLLLRCRGRSGAANKDESIELLSALRNSQLDLRASCHVGRGGTHDVKGKAPRRSGGGGGELLSTGIGKHDYDWLLTPPVSPLWSPATSAAAGDRVSAAAASRLERAFSASHARSNSRQLPLTRRENGSPAASRLARSSFATTSQPSVAHAPGIVFSGRPSSHARTWSYASASASSINTVSNASVTSTRLGSSSATSPRMPSTARSVPAAASRPRHRDKTQALHVFGSIAGETKASSVSRFKPSSTAPTSGARTRLPPGAAGTSYPRSTTAASHQPVSTRRGANAVARSGLVRQSAARSTTTTLSPSPALRPRDVNLAAGASHVSPPTSRKTRQASASEKQRDGNGTAAASTATQRWPPSTPSAAAVVAGRSARREEPVSHRSSRNSDGGRKIDVANTATARRAVGLASSAGADGGSSTTSASGRNKSTNTDTKRQWQGAARHLIAAAHAHRDPSLARQSSRSSVASRSRLSMTSLDSLPSGASSTTVRRPTPGKGKPLAAAIATASPRVVVADAFPSTRYDAMLLREDPENLTWLHGYDDDDDDDAMLRVGLSSTAARL
ncbi:hypothetical protein GUJ93_ZPchr0005g15190 [Zizania palustris]|uniref:Uncharacterized protein n=1 Tax=Zizania palustris TaxID=103762 RepID=A0A8J5SVX5_ZIZPA|nr:hypothetical protein GUJ93_ZPchr0005g15190 [Zizania palustris]